MLRDETRDQLTKTLNALGIQASMVERKRAIEFLYFRFPAGQREENIEKGFWYKSLGLINIEDGPIRWINNLRHDRRNGPKRRVIMLIPDETITIGSRQVKIRTHRKKTFPLFGRTLDVSWSGKDHNLGLIEALSHDVEVLAFAKEFGDIKLKSHAKDKIWTMEVNDKIVGKDRDHRLILRGNKITNSDWSTLQKIANYLLPRRGQL